MIFALVGVIHTIDSHIFRFSANGSNILRNVVICFFLANEGLSILENAALVGVPIPEKLREHLSQLRGANNTKKK